MPRHPSQLYEAVLEGLVLFALLWWLTHARLALRRPGVVAGAFLAGYAAGALGLRAVPRARSGTATLAPDAPAYSIRCR